MSDSVIATNNTSTFLCGLWASSGRVIHAPVDGASWCVNSVHRGLCISPIGCGLDAWRWKPYIFWGVGRFGCAFM